MKNQINRGRRPSAPSHKFENKMQTSDIFNDLSHATASLRTLSRSTTVSGSTLAKLEMSTIRYCNNTDDEAEYRRLARAAESGNAEAMYQLALATEDIFDRKAQVNKESFRWMKTAADAGHAAANYCLGNFYRDGTWANIDYRKAYECYLKAAKMGSSDGMERVGNFYESGVVVPKNEDTAFTLYQRSAELGNPKGAFRLGRCYLTGTGCRQDSRLGFHLISQAVSSGHPGVVGLLPQIGLDIERFITGYRRHCHYQSIIAEEAARRKYLASLP